MARSKKDSNGPYVLVLVVVVLGLLLVGRSLMRQREVLNPPPVVSSGLPKASEMGERQKFGIMAFELFKMHAQNAPELLGKLKEFQSVKNPHVHAAVLQIAAARRIPEYQSEIEKVLAGKDESERMSVLLGLYERRDQYTNDKFTAVWKSGVQTPSEKLLVSFGLLKTSNDEANKNRWQQEFLQALGKQFTMNNISWWLRAVNDFPNNKTVHDTARIALASAVKDPQWSRNALISVIKQKLAGEK